MLNKRKVLLSCLCLPLIWVSIFSGGRAAKAETIAADGFIIKADKVVGSGMFATIVRQETSTHDSKPMIRIQYKSAVIYGMSLTKEVNSPRGPVSITLKANGPVTVKGMTVDTTAISFQGACLKAAELIPEIEMEHVVMVAHYMNTEESNIQQLSQYIISGNTDHTQRNTMRLLEDLGKFSGNELEQEINKISSGHLPLLCENGPVDLEAPTNSLKDSLNLVKKPVEKMIDPVIKPITEPLDPILKPVTKPLAPVLKPLEPIKEKLDPILKPLKPVTDQLKPTLKPLKSIVSDPIGTVDQTIQSVCVNLNRAKGIINKELALKLIDEAIKQKLTLTSICQEDSTVTTWLNKWNDSLLKSLGLIDLLGALKIEDPLEQLSIMREKVSKEKEGAIIFSP